VPGVQVKEVQRRTEALNLQLGGLDTGIAKIAQYSRTDEAHNKCDDRQDD
jgi:hypothetical protein